MHVHEHKQLWARAQMLRLHAVSTWCMMASICSWLSSPGSFSVTDLVRVAMEASRSRPCTDTFSTHPQAYHWMGPHK